MSDGGDAVPTSTGADCYAGPVAYYLDPGDGSALLGPQATTTFEHTYTTIGTFTATVKAVQVISQKVSTDSTAPVVVDMPGATILTPGVGTVIAPPLGPVVGLDSSYDTQADPYGVYALTWMCPDFETGDSFLVEFSNTVGEDYYGGTGGTPVTVSATPTAYATVPTFGNIAGTAFAGSGSTDPSPSTVFGVYYETSSEFPNSANSVSFRVTHKRGTDSSAPVVGGTLSNYYLATSYLANGV